MSTDPVNLADWPRDPASRRLLCTYERPMPKGARGGWAHSSVVSVGGCHEGCCDDYRCTNCGHEWRVEVAE